MDKRPTALAELSGCPFAMPAAPRSDTAAFYCRLPGGRVRVPTPAERVTFCRSGHYDLCPVVARHVRER